MKIKLALLTTVCSMVFLSCSNNSEEKDRRPEGGRDSAAVKDTTTASANSNETAPPDSAAMMKAWEDFKTPGEMHKKFAAREGKWEGEAVSFNNGQAGPPEKVTAEYHTIFNGLYQEEKFSGNMMGTKFEGRGMLAYDNARKKFINTWVDNMGSGLLCLEGDYSEKDNSITLSGNMTDPSTGKPSMFKQVVSMPDNKSLMYVMYADQGGKEQKMMEVKLRKKG
jgi:hypothetical protein